MRESAEHGPQPISNTWCSGSKPSLRSQKRKLCDAGHAAVVPCRGRRYSGQGSLLRAAVRLT
jgi:hypothetical protein